MPCSTHLHLSQAAADPQPTQSARLADRCCLPQRRKFDIKSLHQSRQRLVRAAAPDSAQQSNNSEHSSGSKSQIEQLKKPNVLHFGDPAGSSGKLQIFINNALLNQIARHHDTCCVPTALVQSALPSPEQSRQESKPLLGTEASRGAPNASGVKSATLRYDLPTPAVAVRNLVRRLILFSLWLSIC